MSKLAELLATKNMRPVDLARRLKVNKSSITLWGLRRIPAERVLEIEKITGISRHELRPDLYPPPTEGLTAPPEQTGAAA